MDLTIKNKSGVPTLSLSEDFNVILRNNFSAICKAIALRGKVLNELANYLKNDSNAWDTVLNLMRSSSTTEKASLLIQEKTGMSKETVQYLLGLELQVACFYYDLIEVEKMIKDYQKQLAEVISIAK